MARLYLAFPSRLQHLYSLLDNADTAPHHTVSILTVTFTLGENLDDDSAKGYFDEVFIKNCRRLIQSESSLTHLSHRFSLVLSHGSRPTTLQCDYTHTVLGSDH